MMEPATAVTVTHTAAHPEKERNIPISTKTYLYAFCAAVNSCNLGYDIGVSTEAARLIQNDWNLTQLEREIFIGSINFWAMFGAMLAHYFTDKFGRRYTFVWAALGFIVGMVVMATSQVYSILLLGRILVGLGVGLGLAIDPLYIAEVTPAQYRGELVTWSEIATNVGIVLGFATGLFFGGLPDAIEWRVMFSMGLILPCLMIFLVFTVMPESPRWLVSKHREAEAAEVLKTIYPPDYDVDYVIRDIRDSIQRDEQAEKYIGWGTILRPSPSFRRILIVGVGTAVAQQAVGIDAIQYYLLDVIENSGIDSPRKQDIVLISLGILKLLFILVGGKLFDRSGRRPLLFTSLGGMAVALLLIAVAFWIDDSVSTAATIIGLAAYLSFFSIGMGPGAWLIPSEVFPTSIRGKAMSVATFSNRLTATLMSTTFLSTANVIGWGGFFLLLSIISCIVLLFLYKFLPETKGHTLEEMSLYFAQLTGDDYVLQAEENIVASRVSIKSSVNQSAIHGGTELT